MAKSARDVLAKRIRELRLEKGWSQEHLADVCELHRTYIGDIERRKRNVSIDNIEKIALALKVPITEILSE
jgi:transcriptional regulator with XRE-family HTH domain